MIKSLREMFATPDAIFPETHSLVMDKASPLNWAQFCTRVSAWQQVLEPCDAELVALYQRDALDFMAALVALWRLGKRALVPSNNLSASCQQLAELTSCFAGDFPLAGVLNPALGATGPALQALSLVAPDSPALILFTSGSTSQPLPIAKSFAQLEAELGTLEAQWGERLKGAAITCTVSHHHIYGLLFRLLWPLATGRAVALTERDYWEEIAEDAKAVERLVIISSPAHLSRIPPLEWPCSTSIAAIFSSGGPLATAASLAAKMQFGQSVTEVYGSTETGGIAWREQDKSQAWACFPDIAIRIADGGAQMQVRSPHLPDDAWFDTADNVLLEEDGRFSLCGRADRIVKVGGKRISIGVIERTLEQQPGVAQVRVIMLPERGERLAAVVVLNNQGNKRLVDKGKQLINQELKAALEGQLERIAIPRYWRYVNELPLNRQGKTTLAELEALFSSEPAPRLPDIAAINQLENAVVLDLFIPANLYYFDGHFPGRPVLPGVVQTHWAAHYGREHWGDIGEFAGLEAIKFQQIITANQTLRLKLEYQADKGKLYFHYTNLAADVAYASGRILFQQVPA